VLLILLAGPVWGRTGSRLWGQISPGPLARAHRELEGALRCTSCHAGGQDAMPAQCESCHKDIAWLTAHGRGYHARPEVRRQSCASCHPEHAGVDFALIKWPDGSQQRFDHRRTGWALELSHRQVECADCHTAKHRVSPAAPLAPDGGGHWTGLEQSCTACHTDPHRGILGEECSECHDAGKWKVTPGFSHDSTAYPLTGRHVQVKCADCHQSERLVGKAAGGALKPAVFKPVPHLACSDCHTDPHAGRLGAGCDGCHTTRGFKVIEKSKFDHQRTRFPLEGAHAEVRCADCHRDFSTQALKRPAFATCQACHADPHGGTATLAGKPADCSQCHDLKGFARGSFSLARHRNTRYPLEGRHQQVACADCHRRETGTAAAARWGSARVVLRPAWAACTDCHADDHGNQLANRPERDCGACHQLAGWKPSRFDLAAHAKLELPLEGRHAELGCRDCHGVERKGLPALTAAGLGKARFRFRLSETGCGDCHTDPHRGRFANATAGRKALDCTACHGTAAFRPSIVQVAAHADYGFPLEGAHRATPCIACHTELKTAPARRSSLVAVKATFPELKFEAPAACSGCHRTPHGTQFDSRADRGRCDACHGTDGFRPASRLDHDRDTKFPLKGAHERVPCNRCHPTDTQGGDPRRLVYRPLSGKCEDCHAGKETR